METKASEAGIRHLAQARQRPEKLQPFLAERRKLLLPRRCEPVATPPAAVAAGFPCATNPAALFHAVEQRVERGQRKTQRALGLPFDAPGHFIAVQRTLSENAEDGKFGRAALHSMTDHRSLPYMYARYIFRFEMSMVLVSRYATSGKAIPAPARVGRPQFGTRSASMPSASESRW